MFRNKKYSNEIMFQPEKVLIIKQMAAGIAHEVRNPLTSITGFTNILKEKYNNNQSLLEIADTIFHEAGQIKQLVDDLVRIAQPVSPKLRLENFEEIVQDVMARFEKLSQERYAGRIGFSFYKQEGFPEWFYFDLNQIKHVIETLTCNAIDAVIDAGNASNNGLIKYSLRYFPAESQICLDVSDNGYGLTREELEKVGLPFYTTKPNGKGLSLSLSVMLIHNHGGKIEVESEKGKETTFSVYLPVKS